MWDGSEKVSQNEFIKVFEEAADAMKIVWIEKLYKQFVVFQKKDATYLNASLGDDKTEGGMYNKAGPFATA